MRTQNTKIITISLITVFIYFLLLITIMCHKKCEEKQSEEILRISHLTDSQRVINDRCTTITTTKLESDADVWLFEKNADGDYNISSKGFFICMLDDDGKRIGLSTYKANDNCLWKITKSDDDNKYAITNTKRNKPLTKFSSSGVYTIKQLDKSTIYGDNSFLKTLCPTLSELNSYKNFVSDFEKSLSLQDLIDYGRSVELFVKFREVRYRGYQKTLYLLASDGQQTFVEFIIDNSNSSNIALSVHPNGDIISQLQIMWNDMEVSRPPKGQEASLNFGSYLFGLKSSKNDVYYNIELSLSEQIKKQLYTKFLESWRGSPYRYLCCNENVYLDSDLRSEVCSISDYNRAEGQYQPKCTEYMNWYCAHDVSNPICACYSSYVPLEKLSEKERLQYALYEESLKQGKNIDRECLIESCIDSSAYKNKSTVSNCPQQCIDIMSVHGGSGSIIDVGGDVKMSVTCGPTTIIKPINPEDDKYSFIDGKCVEIEDGKYDSLESCQKDNPDTPPSPTKYSWDKVKKECVEDPKGNFDDIVSCQKSRSNKIIVIGISIFALSVILILLILIIFS